MVTTQISEPCFLVMSLRQLSKSNLPPRKDRQISMLSATLPEEVQRLAAEMLQDYIYLTVGVVGGSVNLISQVCG